ncbi:MAG: hypothetical protein PVJ92_03445 [Candidatus Dependentiae bacterium]|jgi:hypothetical protein
MKKFNWIPAFAGKTWPLGKTWPFGKTLSLLALSLFCSAPAHTTPLALTAVAHAIGLDTTTLNETLEDLDFHSSRGFDLVLPIHGNHHNVATDAPLTLRYKGRWGYKGAGDRTQPFSGFSADLTVQFSYDGIIIDPSKSRSLNRSISKKTAPIREFTGTQEFVFKLCLLLWTEAHNSNPNYLLISNHIETLLARLRLTPGGSETTLSGMKVLAEPGHTAFETFFNHAPQLCTSNLLSSAKKIMAGMGLLREEETSSHAYLLELLSSLNYFTTDVISFGLPKGGTVTLPFTYTGSGDAHDPFGGLHASIELPTPTRQAGTQKNTRTATITVELQPEHEFMLRGLLLLLQHRKEPMAMYRLTEEVSTLLARLAITPESKSLSPQVRAGIQVLCSFYHRLIHHDFTQSLVRPLDAHEFMVQLLCVAYKTYTMFADRANGIESEKTAQEIADFATKHTAEALRSFRGFIALKKAYQKNQPLQALEKHGVTIDLQLFLSTLLHEE